VLFLLKRSVWTELAVALALGALGLWGAAALGLSIVWHVDARTLAWGLAGAAALTAWTLLVQAGYARARGRHCADELTASLARYFEHASAPQMACAFAAAAGEELFFRGLVQGAFGLLAGSLAFMLAHIGPRDIRVIGYWSVAQGLGLGLLYIASGNLAVPVLAHGLFDLGAMAYFRAFMSRRRDACASSS
jgi:membrane protease YdiL (CAAX protease family)